jgi:hypothetical protein
VCGDNSKRRENKRNWNWNWNKIDKVDDNEDTQSRDGEREMKISRIRGIV